MMVIYRRMKAKMYFLNWPTCVQMTVPMVLFLYFSSTDPSFSISVFNGRLHDKYRYKSPFTFTYCTPDRDKFLTNYQPERCNL